MTDETIVEQDGITVTKSFDSEGFPVPAVTFRVESDRTDPVAIRLVDEIPDSFGIEQIGFHPDYGSEHWTATGDGVVRFERTVDAGEAFTTVYGVRMDRGQEPTPFLDAPDLDVDPDALSQEDIEDVVPRESSEIVRELAGGKRDSVPGLEDDEDLIEAGDQGATEPAAAAAEPEEAGTAEAQASADAVETTSGDGAEILGAPDDAEPVAESEPTPEASSEESADVDADELAEMLDAGATETVSRSTTDQPDPTDRAMDQDTTEEQTAVESTPQPAQAEDLVTALADQIRAGDADDEDLAVIREAVVTPSESEQVRIEHLQARVSDLEAYTDALEEFIDENGPAESFLDDVEAEVAAVSEEVDAMQSTVASVESDVRSVEATVGDVESTVEDVETTVDDVAERVETVGSRVDAAQGEREALRERLNGLTEELETVEDATDRLDRLAGDLEALDERVADAEDAQMAVQDVRDDVAALEDDVQEIREWRDQLSNVFG